MLDKLVPNRPFFLTLAHLVESDPHYWNFFRDVRARFGEHATLNIMDNSGFEMYKLHQPYYQADRLVELGRLVQADYIVLPDYPGQASKKTIESAEQYAPVFKKAGFGAFFAPQAPGPDKQLFDVNLDSSQDRDQRTVAAIEELCGSFLWAIESPLIDYIGFSILAIPIAYGVENVRDQPQLKLQRYMSRYHFIQYLDAYVQKHRGKSLAALKLLNDKKFHMLGMVDGPNEIELISHLPVQFDTWDTSAAIWAGLNGVQFDPSPTGLIDGKFELHVNFDHYTSDQNYIKLARFNMDYIDMLVSDYNEKWRRQEQEVHNGHTK